MAELEMEPGGSTPPLPRLFLDQTEAWRAEKKFWEMAQPPPPPPPYLRVSMTAHYL